MHISRYARSNRLKSNQAGLTFRAIVISLFICFCIFGALHQVESHAASISSVIKSGINGYCLDDHKNQSTSNNVVDVWGCNGSAAQSWLIDGDNIKHLSSYCLGTTNNDSAKGSLVVLDLCSNAPSQVWLRDQSGFFNPNSGLCLTAPSQNKQLSLSPCSSPMASNQIWQPMAGSGGKDSANTSCKGTPSQKVACYAEKEWTTWQSGNPSHESLLNTYTDGSSYEEWCADFVSYVYKEAGQPFTQAFDGWDENDANNIQNYGFSMHPASSGYIPQPGDIAYFDYNSGHVEIVVSGGKVPTFIYGNSATIDPATGNGQMMANTVTNDGAEGKLIYYLSPN